MKLMFCSCKMCKSGRHRWGNHGMISGVKRKARRHTKQLLKYIAKTGDYDLDIPEKISVSYTD